jgi:hypothetical protein
MRFNIIHLFCHMTTLYDSLIQDDRVYLFSQWYYILSVTDNTLIEYEQYE